MSDPLTRNALERLDDALQVAQVPRAFNAPAGVVRHFRIEEVEHPVEYRSLAAMIDTFATAFASGAIFVDETGYADVNDEAFSAIAARLNPEVPWWTDSV